MANKEKLSVKERHLLARGEELQTAGELDLALRFFQQALSSNPDSQRLQAAAHVVGQQLNKKNHEQRARRQAHAAREERRHLAQIEEETNRLHAYSPDEISPPESVPESELQDEYVPKPRVGPDPHPHLTSQEKYLLKRGNMLFKQKDFEGAKGYFTTGLSLKPDAEEFQFAVFLAEEELKKIEEGRKVERRKPSETPTPAPTPELRQDVTSRTSTAAEMDACFLTRHRLIRKHAERAFRAGEFDTALALYEQGEQLLPDSKIFQKGKEKTEDAILVAAGKKSPGPELLQKLVIVEIVKAQNLFKEKAYSGAIEQCKHIINRVQELHADKIEGRTDLLTSCFSIIGNCHFELGDLTKALIYHMKDVEISAELDVDEAKVRGLANVGRVYAKQKDYVNAIRVWTEKMALPIPQDATEKAWLAHEVGCCYLEIDDATSALTMATVSLETAREAGDRAKEVNAAVLQGQAHMILGDPHKSKEAFEVAVKVARETEDTETMTKIHPVIDELTEKIYELDAEKYGGLPGSPVF